MTGTFADSVDHRPTAGKKKRSANASEQPLEQRAACCWLLRIRIAWLPGIQTGQLLPSGQRHDRRSAGASALAHERFLAVADIDAAGQKAKYI
jgi:hypothetical protein